MLPNIGNLNFAPRTKSTELMLVSVVRRSRSYRKSAEDGDAGEAVSGLTDGMQFYGNSYRATELPKGYCKTRTDGKFSG